MTHRSLTQADIADVNDATRDYIQVMHAVRLDRYASPRNLAAERDRFTAAWAAGAPSPPVFEYLSPPPDLDQVLSAAIAAQHPRHPLGRLLADDLHAARSMLRALGDRSNEAITELTVAEFGVPAPELVARARQIVATRPTAPPEPATMGADAAAELLRAALASAGLDDWTVEVDPLMSARMSVRSVESLVRIQRSATFSEAEVQRLVVHELGTHVARAVNGRQQQLRILGVGIPGYLATEEGLAAWNEQHLGLSDELAMRRYALRVLAAHRSLSSGFVEVFDELAQLTDANDAFAIAQRAKRGMVDMDAPGAHVKDQVYLQGLIAVTEHLQSHPDDHPLLMAGKVGLDHLEWLRALESAGLLVPAEILPGSFRPT